MHVDDQHLQYICMFYIHVCKNRHFLKCGAEAELLINLSALLDGPVAELLLDR